MGLGETAKLVIVGIICVVCVVQIYRHAREEGFVEGVESGFLRALKEICDGHIRIEGRRLIFDEDNVVFYSPETGEKVKEVNIDDLTFVEL